MILKRIIKENHSLAIHSLAFAPKQNSIFATASDYQVNIYDNLHINNHISLISTFTHSLISAISWIITTDDLLLCASSSQFIHILSFAYSKELFKIPCSLSTHLSSHPTNHNLLLSTTPSCIVLYCILSQQPLITLYPPFVPTISIFYSDTIIITASENASICIFNIPPSPSPSSPTLAIRQYSIISNGLDHDYSCIDSLSRVYDGFITKSINGILVRWLESLSENSENSIDKQFIQTYIIQLKNSTQTTIGTNESFISIGTPLGSILIYDLESGTFSHELKHRRSTKPIRSCVFTEKSLLCVDDDSTIWRYDDI